MQVSPVWCFLPVISAAFPLVACAGAWRVVLPVLHIAVICGCVAWIAVSGSHPAVPVLLVVSGAILLLACFGPPAGRLPRFLVVMGAAVLAFLNVALGVAMLTFLG